MRTKTASKLGIIVTTLIVASAVLFAAGIPVQASSIDGKIKSSAKKSYVFKTYLKHDAVKVQSKDGIVTLTGTVSEESHKSMAEETMRGLPGVVTVNNELTVAALPTGAVADARLAQNVRSMLRLHRSVSNDNTNVAVTDGKVILRGKASSEAQKQLTSEYAKDVSGVTDVDNQMTVRESRGKPKRTTGEKIDDASITTQIKTSLLFHHGTDAFDTQVSTHKGVVTLSGTAKNQAEIDLVSKRVNDIHGVKSVVNQMTIEAAHSSTN